MKAIEYGIILKTASKFEAVFLNENSNGLLRRYFPKAMKLVDVTKEQVQ